MRPLAFRTLPLLALGLAACADQSASPLDPSAPLAASASAAGDRAAARHVVVFRAASGAPQGFAARVQALGGTVEAQLAPVGAAVVRGLSDEAAAALSASGDVQSVEGGGGFVLDARAGEPVETEAETAGAAVASTAAPQTARLYSYGWNMRAIRADAAWAAGELGSPEVTVAILDTGIDPTGPDLVGLVDLARSRSFVAADDSVTRERFPARAVFTDLDGHGTNVAAQVSSNAAWLPGVTSRTRLMAVRVCSVYGGFCPDAATLQGLVHAVDAGADVINLSLGGSVFKSRGRGSIAAFQRAFNYAHRKGVTVVVAVGNGSIDRDHDGDAYATYCGAPNVICVSATGPLSDGGGTGPFEDPDAFAAFSSYGRSAVDVAAPGGNWRTESYTYGEETWTVVTSQSRVWSICSKTKLTYDPTFPVLLPNICSTRPATHFLSGYQGTSQAAPHVAGLAALLVARHGRDPSAVRRAIVAGADDLGQPGTDPFYGKGRINVARTLGL
jgi:lantibiotic leader peptide-processing serine protease